MLLSGKWISPNPGGHWIGLHLNSIYPPWDSCRFGSIASQYVRAKIRRDPEIMAKFVNNYLALPYDFEEAGATIVSEDAIEDTRQDYMRNQIQPGVKVLVIGVDVRLTEVHCLIEGWGAKGESWRISWHILSDLTELETFIKDQVWDHPTGAKMKIAVGGIDCRYRRQDVIDLCRRLPILKAVQGEARIHEPGTAGEIPWKPTALDRDSKGKALPGSLYGYRINTLYFKEYIYAQINAAQRKKDEKVIWHMPKDRDETFERHMQSEQEVMRRKRGSGELQRVWIKRKGYEANHYLDCQVYACGMAHVHKLMHMKPDTPIIPGGGQAARKKKGAERSVRKPFVDPGRVKL